MTQPEQAGYAAGDAKPPKAAVFGSGSWGTAFAIVLADAGCEVVTWARRKEVVDAINTGRTNPDYFPGAELPASVRATTDPAEAAHGADFTVLSVPSQTLRDNLAAWTPHLAPDTLLVSLMKGIELGSAKRMSEVIGEVAGVLEERVAVVTGPNLAKEIVARMPAAAVVACRDEENARRLQAACHTPYFRPYTNTDVVGCELGGAVKNVIGLAVGIADGMGLGDNAKGSLITRGLAETTRLGLAMGADPLTFSGLAGLGDLVATCSSPLSRNHTFGTNLGRGMTLAETIAVTKQTAEGVKSCESVLDLARRHGVDMPITETVVGIVHEGKPPMVALKELMSRAAKPERR
ncbi:NAD(P)H-dependent glycerol-3-phosphate dehydrogenase [Streptomyces sp. NPDC046887]|uniref:NAD(P)H-dependent glycerol-3-phosphate dehydrogenase n=1 Tax=Streptomyces sp. NPDC046887 TaxID=3155472 RepID=UPI0033C8820C